MTDQRDTTPDDTSTLALPAARTADLAKTAARGELIVYDLRVHHIHHLNATAAAVWSLCDGRRTLVELTRDAGRRLGAEVDVATVRIALTKLDQAALLERPLPARTRLDLPTRRVFLRRAAASGLIAVPVIASMTAPTAAQTFSPPVRGCSQEMEPCNTPDDCCAKGSECVWSVKGQTMSTTVCHLPDLDPICLQDGQTCVSTDECCPSNLECTNKVDGVEQAEWTCQPKPSPTCMADWQICYGGGCCNETSVCTDQYGDPSQFKDTKCVPAV